MRGSTWKPVHLLLIARLLEIRWMFPSQLNHSDTHSSASNNPDSIIFSAGFSDCYLTCFSSQRSKYYEHEQAQRNCSPHCEDTSSLQKLAVQMKTHIEHVKLISSHLIRTLHVDELGTVLIADEQSVAELGGCLFAAR